jgi:hypothetical protein
MKMCSYSVYTDFRYKYRWCILVSYHGSYPINCRFICRINSFIISTFFLNVTCWYLKFCPFACNWQFLLYDILCWSYFSTLRNMLFPHTFDTGVMFAYEYSVLYGSLHSTIVSSSMFYLENPIFLSWRGHRTPENHFVRHHCRHF